MDIHETKMYCNKKKERNKKFKSSKTEMRKKKFLKGKKRQSLQI